MQKAEVMWSPIPGWEKRLSNNFSAFTYTIIIGGCLQRILRTEQDPAPTRENSNSEATSGMEDKKVCGEEITVWRQSPTQKGHHGDLLQGLLFFLSLG